MAAETKKAKNLRIASWIILTVVPAVFAVLVLFFNWGFDAKGYVEKTERSIEAISIIEPKVIKLENELSLNNLSDIFLKAAVEKDGERVDKLIEEVQKLNRNVSILNTNVEQVMDRNNQFWEEDWTALTSKIDKLIDRKK